ncbi:MAG: AfsR/SARP family transcriptional regulator [Stenotrophomonas sp.]
MSIEPHPGNLAMSAWPGNAQPLIRLLGQCRIGDGGRLAYRKGWALLAYLAIERPRMHRRSRIAAMLWPDLAPGAALTNLRQVLADLNRAIVAVAGEGVLLIDRENVHLCPEASQGLFDIDLLEPAQIVGNRRARVAGGCRRTARRRCPGALRRILRMAAGCQGLGAAAPAQGAGARTRGRDRQPGPGRRGEPVPTPRDARSRGTNRSSAA